ncbi:MAG: class I SAM-dependent methyltransferase [Pseudomonadota bacterium]
MADLLDPELLEQVRAREWFYDFPLPDGSRTTTYHAGELDAIHDTRWRLLEHTLDGAYPQGFSELTAIDLAAHQGWFALGMARAGLRQVTCVDQRASHVEDAQLMARVQGQDAMRFLHSDIFDLDTERLGTFDVVLMLGLLYHLENPVGALRLARALCKDLFVIETQIVPGMSGMVDFGSYRFVRPLKGAFGLIDELDETHGPEAGATGICLVPSLEALTWLLEKVGFREVTVLQPPPDAYEQLLYGKRVMVSARV